MIRSIFREAARRFLVGAARKSLRQHDFSGDAPAALVIPPAVPGSIGDAAMLSTTIRVLRSKGFQKVDLLYGEKWPLDEQVDERIPSSRFFYNNSPKEEAHLVNRLAKYSHVYFVGADVLDGAYNPGSICRRISLIKEASIAGRSAVILGSSYNESPEVSTLNAIRSLPRQVKVCARDPQSFLRLKRVMSREILLVADVAFLLEPKPEEPSALNAIRWIVGRRKKGNQVVALNINYLQIEKDPSLLDAYANIMERLLYENVSLLLVPHDSRTDRPDVYHLRTLEDRFKSAFPDKLYLLETASPGAVKASLAQVDMLVTGRLHAMILAMGSGTPSIGIVYQSKFEGVFELFNIDPDHYLYSPDEVMSHPERIISGVRKILASLSDERSLITAALPNVMAKASLNFTC